MSQKDKNQKSWSDYTIYGVGAGIVTLGLATIFAAAVVLTQEPKEMCATLTLSQDGTNFVLSEPVPCDN